MAHKLSIVAQFDDLCRNKKVLMEDCVEEFQTFVLTQEACRLQWLAAESGHLDLKKQDKVLEDENSKLQTKLKHARNQIDHEMRKRVRSEQDKDALDRNIKMVRDLLTDKNSQSVLNPRDREKLAFLSTDFQFSHIHDSPQSVLPTIEESASLLSDDISYDDELEESYNLRNGQRFKKRATAPPVEELTPPEKRQRHMSSTSTKEKPRRSKKHRRSNSASVITTTSVTVKEGHIRAESKISRDNHLRNDSLKKYPSAGDVKNIGDSEEETTPKAGILKDLYTPGSYGMHRSSSNKSLNRPHNFVSRTVLLRDNCLGCGKKIKFSKSALKCTDCKATAHVECKEQVPLPCVPSTCTPHTSKSTSGTTLQDFMPSLPPYIPALVIHCVNEVETRGLTQKGIYRECGSEREIKELKEKFLRGRLPNLSQVNDLNVVCGCLKDFLRGLKDKVITRALWDSFVKAAENADTDEGISSMYQAISELPKAHRDTLAFVIIHLQRISESEYCSMGVDNLSRVFGPTLVGFSCDEPEPLQMINETHKQKTVVQSLMSLSRDYWQNIMEMEDTFLTPGGDYTTAQTPETDCTYRGLRSMLGPVNTTPDTDGRGSWRTPRFGNKSRNISKKPTQFFSSPDCK